MSTTQDSKQKFIAISAIIIIALLGVNAYLWYNKYQQDAEISKQAQELEEAEQLRTDLEKEYYEALSELEEMRGSNEGLNALIDQQKIELKEQKDKIAGLIRKGKSSRSELEKARQSLTDMRAQLDGYITEINQLKEDKQLLSEENVRLSEERSALQEEVSVQKQVNDDLTTAKAALVSEKEQLEGTNAQLSKKVNIASVIKMKDIEVKGQKVRGNGKVVGKSSAKRVDRLQVCFTTSENNVTDAGTEKFYVRILNPIGETLAVEAMGSGVMTNEATGEEMRFTLATDMEYENAEAERCVIWQPTNASFMKGVYEVEIYNKGNLAGKSSVKLK